MGKNVFIITAGITAKAECDCMREIAIRGQGEEEIHSNVGPGCSQGMRNLDYEA